MEIRKQYPSVRERFPDYNAANKHYYRQWYARSNLRNVHALIDCRQEWLTACYEWLYGKKAEGSKETTK